MHPSDSPPPRPILHRVKSWLRTKEKKEEKEPKEIKKNHSTDVFPEGVNLIGNVPMTFSLNGSDHVIAFRADSILIDAFTFTVCHYDRELELTSAIRTGDSFTLETNGNITMTKRFADVLETLLQNGTYEDKAQSIVISRF